MGQLLTTPILADELTNAQALAQIYADLTRRERVLNGTIQVLGLPGDWATLADRVSTRIVPGTVLLEISVVDIVPDRAAVIANEIANQLILQTPAANDTNRNAERQFILSQIVSLKTNLQRGQDEMRQLDDVIAKASSARQIQDARNRQAALLLQVTTWQSTYAQLIGNSRKACRMVDRTPTLLRRLARPLAPSSDRM